MNSIFVGLLLLFLNFDIDLGSSSIGLLPSFVGAYLIWKGTRALAAESGCMRELDTVLKTAIGIHAVIWVCNFFGGVSAWSGLFVLLGLAAIFLNLYILYQLTGGVEELEQLRGVDMRSAILKRCWGVVCVCQILTWVPWQRNILYWFSVIIGLVGLVAYLSYFNDAKKAYVMSTEYPGGIVRENEEENTYDP